MKIYSNLSGKMGDTIIGLRLSQYLKEQNPDCEIVGGVAEQFSSILPVLQTAPYVDRYVVWRGYCQTFPSSQDQEIIDKEQFDLFLYPNPGHSRPDWFNNHHQMSELFLRYGYAPPSDLQISLPKPIGNSIVAVKRDAVAFAPFGGDNQGIKCLSTQKAQDIVNYLNKIGKFVIQLGAKDEPQLEFAHKPNCDWLETAKILNDVEFCLTTDTAVSWLSSAYQTPTIGLYSIGYYAGAKSSKTWEPINPNANYLSRHAAENIPMEEIINMILYYNNKYGVKN